MAHPSASPRLGSEFTSLTQQSTGLAQIGTENCLGRIAQLPGVSARAPVVGTTLGRMNTVAI